jgi:hypothetical protein
LVEVTLILYLELGKVVLGNSIFCVVKTVSIIVLKTVGLPKLPAESDSSILKVLPGLKKTPFLVKLIVMLLPGQMAAGVKVILMPCAFSVFKVVLGSSGAYLRTLNQSALKDPVPEFNIPKAT